MQFQYNSDYPAATDPTARTPIEFPAVSPIPCARMTTRVYHPTRNTVATVQNVLVRIAPRARRRQSRLIQQQQLGGGGVGDTSMSDAAAAAAADASMSSSSSSSSDFSDDESMEDSNNDGNNNNGGGVKNATTSSSEAAEEEEECAYWIQRTVRDAIYGRVVFAVVLRKRKQPIVSNSSSAQNSNSSSGQQHAAEWEVTPQHCAVKEMSWQHIRRERDRLAEDPIKEVAAMQYLKDWHNTTTAVAARRQQQPNESSGCGGGVQESFRNMLQTNVMMPLDLLSDERNLYSIMPYCNGGELFDLLDMNDRFTEPEARYWMRQILNGIESLQHAGICHRDMSLENLLVHESGALIIDMGMCLRLPFDETAATTAAATTTTANHLSASFGSMNMNGGQQQQHQIPSVVGGSSSAAATTVAVAGQPIAARVSSSASSGVGGGGRSVESVRNRKRYMVSPQGTCGKMIYMSPEIFSNREPFDGFAVDMWAAGVILFLMLTGFPPWEQAAPTDLRFKYMTEGFLVQMLTEWEIGISSDGMDLLQRMLFLDPKDRLSLDQVRAHPWMVNGPCQPPRPASSGM